MKQLLRMDKVLVTCCLGNKADLIKEKHPEAGYQNYENPIESGIYSCTCFC